MIQDIREMGTKKVKTISIDRICDWDLMEYSDRVYHEAAPMSDDVLDAGVHYLSINRKILGVDDDEQID